VVDTAKEFGQVHVHDHALARLDVATRGLDRVMCPPAETKPVAVLAETDIDDEAAALAAGLAGSVDPALWGCPARAGSHPVWGSSPCVPDWAGSVLSAGLGRCPANWSAHAGGLLDVEPVHPCRPFVGLDPLARHLQVLSRQRHLQQASWTCHQLCRPCAPVRKKRAAGFVADRVTPGFTACYARPDCYSI
jgi:hypothetical protein